MEARKSALFFMFFLAAATVFYLYESVKLEVPKSIDSQSTYPIILGTLLFIFIIIDAFQTMKEESSRINISNFLTIFITIIFTIIYIFAWQSMGYFYIFTFIYMVAELTLLRERTSRYKLKTFLLNIGISLITTIMVYVIFDIVLEFNF